MTASAEATPVPRLGHPTVLRRVLCPRNRTLGPALLIGAGYVDPGNWGTDVAAGADFAYRLLWVLAAAMAAALFLQHLSASLGFITGRDLASLLRQYLPPRMRTVIVPLLLVALAVTEVVEVLGVVIGVQLLTGWSAAPCVATATGLVVLLLLAPGDKGRRVTYGCLAGVAVVYVTVLAVHGSAGVARGLVPQALPPGGLPIAVGLVGAVIMPHNILLQSALARDVLGAEVEGVPRSEQRARLQRSSLRMMAVALTLALAVNCAIVSVAVHPGASSGLESALRTARPTFGAATGALFAMTLIGAGLASSMTGGMASVDVIGHLFPGLRMPDAARRLLCLVPAGLVAASGVSVLFVLVWSQVVLTLALPLVLVPLIWFTSRYDIVGQATLGRVARVAAWALTGAICAAGVAAVVFG